MPFVMKQSIIPRLLAASLVALAMLVSPCKVAAQGASVADKNIRVVYIEHNLATDVPALLKILGEFMNDTYYDGAVFYLSNGSESKMLKYNVDDNSNTREEFDAMLGQLNSGLYHNVDAQTDLDNLVRIFDDLDIVDEDNKLKAKSLEVLFYVTGNYFELGLHQAVIAPLFSILDIPHITPAGDVQFQVLYSPDDSGKEFLTRPEPFGKEDIDGINEYITGNRFVVTY